MYITKVVLENVRCFRKVVVDLESHGKPKMWTVLVGDNGDGKTALLRSIAMGLCDESSAAGLLRELPGEFVRDGETKATIKIELKNRRGKRHTIITDIQRLVPFEKVQ